MSLQIEATYEGGVLKLDEALPLKEHERVLVTIELQSTRRRRAEHGKATDSSAGPAIRKCSA